MLIREVIRADIRFVFSFHELVKCFERTTDPSVCVRPQINRREFNGALENVCCKHSEKKVLWTTRQFENEYYKSEPTPIKRRR